MEYLLCNIINHISDNMPEVNLVDEDYGQLEAQENENQDMYPLTYPAVLIDAPETEWSNLQGGSQEGTATIRVRLVLDCYDDTHAGSGTTERIQERAEMAHSLHTLLQGFAPDEEKSWKLNRQSSRYYTASHGIKVYEDSYTVTVYDYIKDTETVQKSKVHLQMKSIDNIIADSGL